jgi:hypothetical protein
MSQSPEAHEILARLDMIVSILQLAFKPQMDAARSSILSDPVASSVLDATSDGWVDAGELRQRVARETKQSERTVSRRVSALLAQRAIEQSGTGAKIRYRSTGHI